MWYFIFHILIFVSQEVIVTNPLTSGILFSTSSIFVLKAALVTKLLVSCIFLSVLSNFFYLNLICLHYILIFLGASLSTNSLDLFKSIETVPNLLTSKVSTLLFKLFKLLDAFTSLFIFNFSTSNFKLAKSIFLAKPAAPKPVASFKSNLF